MVSDVGQPQGHHGLELGRIWGQFRDPDMERGFREARRDADVRRLSIGLVFGGLTFPLFGLTRVISSGVGDGGWALLASEFGMLFLTLLVVVQIRREPAGPRNTLWVTLAELAATSIVVVLAIGSPGHLYTHNLEFVGLMLGMLIFIPNRVPCSLAVVVIGGIAYAIAGTTTPVGAQRLGLEDVMTIAVILAVGLWTTVLLERSRREEYGSFVAERRSRQRLEAEMDQREALQEELEWMASHDALTDLYNRRAFLEQADRVLAGARRREQPVSVLLLDADEFKSINDMFGHHTGDEAIRAIGRQAKLCLRADDVIGRVGGEEFAVVMPATNLALAEQVASRLREQIGAVVIEHPDGGVSFTVSIGITECRIWNETIQDALQRADAAMYEAKLAGRNRVIGV